MNPDGWVIIGTDLDTKKLERKLNETQRKLKSFEKENEQLTKTKAKLELDLSDYYKEKDLIEESTNEWLSQAQTQEEVNKILQGENENVAMLNEKYATQLKKIEDVNLKLKENTVNQGKLKSEIDDTIKKINASKTKDFFESQGKSVEKLIKKITKMALAVFGLRSAYMFVRSAISQIIAEDERMKYQIEYIKYSLGQAIKPIAEFIVNIVYKIATGIGAILKLLFGINIFSKATKDNFKKANQSATKLKKTLAGFDELDVINDDGTTGIGSSINNALSDIGDLSTEVDSLASKIKKWFWGGEYNSITDAIVGNLKKVPQNLYDTFHNAYDYVIKPYLITPFLQGLNNIKEAFRPIWEPLKASLTNTIDNYIKPKWDALKEYMSQRIEILRPIWEPIKEGFINVKNKILNIFAPFLNAIIDAINFTFGIFGVHLDRIEIKSEETGDEIVENIGGALDNVEENASNLSNQEFNININTSNINEASLGISSVWDNLKQLVSKPWKVVVNFVSDAATSVGNAFSSAWSKIKNFFGFANGGIIVPKLATGGIINQPGRGVPLASAIGGERGAEGVIPLTDSQQMALLGEAIGKYITINANIVNTMNGRVISKELQKIQNENDFAYNR